MKTQHELLMENPDFRRLFAIELLTAEASELIARLMAERKVSKADLARKLGKSRSWITQLLSGKTNMTVGTLAEIANAMDAEVRLQEISLKAREDSHHPGIYTFEDQLRSSRGGNKRNVLRQDDAAHDDGILRPEYAA